LLKLNLIKFIFQEKLHSLITDQPTLKPHSEIIFRKPSLYGDYRTALDMGEARIYEDIQDYEAAKALFDEVQNKTSLYFIVKFLFLFFRFFQNIMNNILV